MHIIGTILVILLFAALYAGAYIFTIVIAADNHPDGTDIQEYLYKCLVSSMHYTNKLYL